MLRSAKGMQDHSLHATDGEIADVAVPEVMEALNGADLRSLDVPKPSFDDVFLRLVRGTNQTA